MAAVKETIIGIIDEAKSVPTPVSEHSNLYTDLSFDSLSYIALLVKIEEAYSITFDLREMEMCLQIDRLIERVQNKIGERGNA